MGINVKVLCVNLLKKMLVDLADGLCIKEVCQCRAFGDIDLCGRHGDNGDCGGLACQAVGKIGHKFALKSESCDVVAPFALVPYDIFEASFFHVANVVCHLPCDLERLSSREFHEFPVTDAMLLYRVERKADGVAVEGRHLVILTNCVMQ